MADAPGTSIRLVEPEDAEALAAIRTRDTAKEYLWDPIWPDDFYTAAGQRERIQRALDRHSVGAAWPGVVLAGDEVIGRVTVQSILRREWLKGELGYWIAAPHRGVGHATRAVRLVLKVMAGDLALHRAEAYTQMDNLGSQHILRSNGFSPFGVARGHMFLHGAWRDDILWERVLDQ